MLERRRSSKERKRLHGDAADRARSASQNQSRTPHRRVVEARLAGPLSLAGCGRRRVQLKSTPPAGPRGLDAASGHVDPIRTRATPVNTDDTIRRTLITTSHEGCAPLGGPCSARHCGAMLTPLEFHRGERE